MMSEVVGQKGVYSLMSRVHERGERIKPLEIQRILKDVGVSEELFAELTGVGLFIGVTDGFYLSSLGKKITLLLRTINDDEEISEVFQQLTHLYPNIRPYELITENVTDYFIDSLYTKAEFIRISICSPWIRLDEHHIEEIKNSILNASRLYNNVQLHVITLPLDRYSSRGAIATLEKLKELGAEIVTNRKLHAKLYISEPGPRGGSHYAILGSENLTGKGHIELAIKIENDNEILRKLNRYFYDIWQDSEILRSVNND